MKAESRIQNKLKPAVIKLLSVQIPFFWQLGQQVREVRVTLSTYKQTSHRNFTLIHYSENFNESLLAKRSPRS